MKRRALLFLFLLGGAAACIIALLWMLASIFFAPNGPRIWCIAIAFDQLGNAVGGGSEDETISSRAGRERKEGRKWACVLCRVLDWLKKDHCKDSVGT